MTIQEKFDQNEVALADYQSALDAVTKVVNIEIALKDLENLKKSGYRLCFAKKVGDNAFNVVWTSSFEYLVSNTFSWQPQYSVFGTNTFKADIQVKATTNVMPIQLQQIAVMNKYGIIENPSSGGPDVSFQLDDQYGSIHPGVNQLSTGIDGVTTSTPIYVAEDSIVRGTTTLTPVEKILVWFEQDVETSTMFSDSRSNAVEIDLTTSNTQTRKYENQGWTTP